MTTERQRRDIFRPRKEPARTIYDAFVAESAHRAGRSSPEWEVAERNAVWIAARDYAQQNGLSVPRMSDVERAERFALGHTDYGAKWARGVAVTMTPNERAI